MRCNTPGHARGDLFPVWVCVEMPLPSATVFHIENPSPLALPSRSPPPTNAPRVARTTRALRPQLPTPKRLHRVPRPKSLEINRKLVGVFLGSMNVLAMRHLPQIINKISATVGAAQIGLQTPPVSTRKINLDQLSTFLSYASDLPLEQRVH